jgi:uncharacterized DUF497 family protein
VRFDFDPGKDVTNLGKHGLSLAAAAELGWEQHSSGLMIGLTMVK